MDSQMILKLVSFLSLLSLKAVNGEFILTVNFINYSNPTGLCAECSMTRLENVTSGDQLVPVCCDEPPFNRTQDCDNTGEERCDTRFRWTIRPFGASLETRPGTVLNASSPPYFFTRCYMSPTTCPFSKISTTFGQGDTSFLGVAANPLPVMSRNITTWTGKIQFFIEAVDSMLPNIIDSLLVNLDNLELGQPEFTEEITYSGFYNISHMTMSFKVECAPGFCGSNCTITSQNNPLVSECGSDGTVVCIGSGIDPLTNCTDCLPNRNISTNCTTCLTGFSGESCSEDNLDQSPGPKSVAGPVAGAVVGVLVLAVIVAVIIVVAILLRCPPNNVKKASATNTTYDNVGPPTATTTPHTGTTAPLPLNDTDERIPASHEDLRTKNLEADFNNPLYNSSGPPMDQDYSSPWDSGAEGSLAKPQVISSPNSTHAVLIKVNSNAHSQKDRKKSSEGENQVEYASIGNNVSTNTAPPSSADYTEPANSNVPQPIYDSVDLPSISTQSYNYIEVETRQQKAADTSNVFERTFDNTGEQGVYYSPSEAVPHRDDVER